MKKKRGNRLLSLVLSVMLLFNMVPFHVLADTKENTFVLVVESQGALVIAPEYITYTEGQTIREALMASEHEFIGIEDELIMEIDGIGGNYTRSDENGDYSLNKQASEIKYYRFSEETDSKPSEGLQQLMTAMADYKEKDADVQAAAKEKYDTACTQFVGLDSESAIVLAENLNKAISDYESAQAGAQHKITFTDGNNTYSGVSITAENDYGKVWEDDGDGILSLPDGSYHFCISENGLSVQGSIAVSGDMTVKAALPEELWLNLENFRLSGSYGAEDNEENKFSDDEFTLGEWTGREITVPVSDTFTGTVYSYAEYNTELLSDVPHLTAIYQSAKTEQETKKEIPFESFTSGAENVLKKGAAGNQVVYRVSSEAEDGYTG